MVGSSDPLTFVCSVGTRSKMSSRNIYLGVMGVVIMRVPGVQKTSEEAIAMAEV